MATRIIREDPHTPRFKSASAARNKHGKKFGPTRDRNYLTFVRARPCCVCGSPGPSHAHHHGPRGMGQKTDDRRTVPLCERCHRHWHDHACFSAAALSVTLQAINHMHATMVTLLLEWQDAMESAA